MSSSQTIASRQQVHKRIIEWADQRFRKDGIRAVRMDDLASELGISKRTLYEEFSDKETLLRAVNSRNKENMHQLVQQFQEESENVLTFMLKIFRFTFEQIAQTNPKYFQEMQKYPSFCEDYEKGRAEHQEATRQLITRGMDEGLFHRELNLELFMKAQQLIQESALVNLRDEYGMVETFRATLLITLRGISTEKGVKILDDFDRELRQGNI